MTLFLIKTYDQVAPVVDRWNTIRYNSSRSVRKDFFNNPNNLVPMRRRLKSGLGGEMTVRYRQDTGPNYSYQSDESVEVAVNIEHAVAEIEGVEDFPGLSMAWKWSPMRRFVFSLALDGDEDWAYQVNSLDNFDEGLVREVLAFARRHRIGRAEQRPITVITGFAYGTYGFDAVAAVTPAVHGYHIGRNERLNEVVSGVFPAYECEFRGDETHHEALERFKRMLNPTVMPRTPAPYLRMRYENTRTGSGSVGDARGFTTHDVLVRELELLEGASGSFVEFENFRGDVWLVEWDGAWRVNGSRWDAPPSQSWIMEALGLRRAA